MAEGVTQQHASTTATRGWSRFSFFRRSSTKLDDAANDQQSQECNGQDQRRQHQPSYKRWNLTPQPEPSQLQQELKSKQQDANNNKTTMAPKMPRRPSIPSSIHSKEGADDDENSSQSSSVISEVTLMTYSKERSELIRNNFIERMRQHQQTTQDRQLSMKEREALLREIQQEQDWKLRRQTSGSLHEKKRRKSLNEDNDHCNELLEQLRELQQKHELHLLSDSDRTGGQFKLEESERTAMSKESEEGGAAASGVFSTGRKARSQDWREQRMSRAGGGLAMSFSSIATVKRSHSKRDTTKEEALDVSEISGDQKDPEQVVEDCDNAPQASSRSTAVWVEDQEQCTQTNENQKEESSSSQAEQGNIAELIKLKLQVANQQATIDTLSSRLHNLELVNRQLQYQDNSRLKQLEEENASLTTQLNECREREIALRNELTLASRTYREREEIERARMQEIKKKNEEVERENEVLRRELALLQQQQQSQGRRIYNKRSSMSTVSTVASTVAGEGSDAHTL